MQNGVTFNGEGPLMSGTWYNPSNGDSFTVADSFFQDNQYIVKTTDGRMLDYNFIQHYIKSDKPIEVPKKENSQQLPAEIQSMIEDDILPEDQHLIMGNPKPIGNLYSQNNQQDSTNNQIINKALNKKTAPKLAVSIEWKDFPKKELDMLIEVLDINKDEILDWYLNKIDINTIKSSIKESLINWLNKNLCEVVIEPEIKPIVNEKKTSKSTNSIKKKTKVAH